MSLRSGWARGFESGAEALDGGFVEADESFHFGVADPSATRTFAIHSVVLNDRIRIIRMVDLTSRERIATTRAEHDAVLEVIGRRDADAARNLM